MSIILDARYKMSITYRGETSALQLGGGGGGGSVSLSCPAKKGVALEGVEGHLNNNFNLFNLKETS